MDLPLLLAGPILRRVEPHLVSVWIATSEAAEARLLVWEGLVKAETSGVFAESLNMRLLRVGAHLYVGQVTLELPPTTGKSFQPDTTYSYDLEIHRFDTDEVDTLLTLRMLEDRVVDGVAHLPLGLEPKMLPSFAPPPSRLEDLNILYGSCRRPLHRDPDALAMVDDLIFGKAVHKDPRRRPHQLFLGGDQIYADDVSPLHMPTVIEVGVELIGTRPGVTPTAPVEHLPVDTVAKFNPSGPADPDAPWDLYQLVDTPGEIPADREHWPERRRLRTTLVDAQFTSTDGDSHLLSLGEFAACYLSVWSPAVWGEEVIGARWAPDADNLQQTQPLRWDQVLPPLVKGQAGSGAIVLDDVTFPETIAGHFYEAPRKPPEEKSPQDLEDEAFKDQKGLRKAFAIHAEFRKNLPRVQRALANVSTYMIMDDHDVTDDFFLNPTWRRRVLGTRLGRAVLGNAMTSYALFQDWGNDPVAYRTSAKSQLLAQVERLFPEGAASGPDASAFAALSDLFGHRADGGLVPVGVGGRTESAEPPLKWHFTIDGPKHRAIALDNRTRRQFASENGPPGNVSPTAMVDQIPEPPLPAGREILLVIAPLQVIGPPVLDELVAPLSYRIFDMVQSSKEHSELNSENAGARGMLGTDPDAIEAWSFDVDTFEHLLRRLEPYGRVVLLSGDVHYSAGSVMSYWKGDAAQPARFAQFTSSGFKNVMPPFITLVDSSLGLAQQLIRLGLGTERLGWDQPSDDLVTLPPGVTVADLPPVMRTRLRQVPVVLPTWGWPDLTVLASTPDWRWRITPLLDERPNDQRPRGIQHTDLDPDVEGLLADPTTVFEGYQKVAARHQKSLNRLRNARQILFRANVGRVRFAQEDGKLQAIHEVYTTFADPDQIPPVPVEPEPFLVQQTSLGPEDEEPPTRLRRPALEPPEVVS